MSSLIGLPIYGDAGDTDFTRDIARTDFPGILSSRSDFLGGIGPARKSNPLLRTCPSVAIPLGRLNPSHRMGCTSPASRRLRSSAFPVCLPARLSSKGGLNPRPLLTTINIHECRIYGKDQSYIRLRIHDIGTIAASNAERGKEKAIRRACRPTDRHAISCLPSPVSVRTCR